MAAGARPLALGFANICEAPRVARARQNIAKTLREMTAPSPSERDAHIVERTIGYSITQSMFANYHEHN